MTPVDTRSNDTKLLLGIAGLVVLGTAGIALLAGWSANQDATAGATRSVAAPSAAVHSPRPVEPVRRAALPASLELPPAPRPAPFEPAAEIAGPQADAPFVPQPGEPYVERGLESYNARDYARAIGYWQAEVDARPQRAWTQYMLALSLWKAGQLDRAAAAMEGAIAVDPTSIKSLVNLARIRNDGGEYAAALEAAAERSRSIRAHPRHSSSRRDRCSISAATTRPSPSSRPVWRSTRSTATRRTCSASSTCDRSATSRRSSPSSAPPSCVPTSRSSTTTSGWRSSSAVNATRRSPAIARRSSSTRPMRAPRRTWRDSPRASSRPIPSSRP